MSDVYLIHGWTYSLDKYQGLVKELADKGIDVKLLKVPGLTTPSDKVWTMDGYVDWLDNELKSTSRPIVVGHSNGGRIALSYLQKHPAKIDKLILIDSAGIDHNDALSKAKLTTYRYVAKAGKVFSFMPLLKKVYYRLIGASDYYKAPPNMKLTMQNMIEANKHIDLAQIKVPTTIIWGREDSVTPLADGQKLHAGIVGSTLEIVDGARHSPIASHPETVADIINKVLKSK